MSLNEKIEKSLNEKWMIRIKTSHPDKDAYDGIVVSDKSEFIVINQERDLEFDGIVFLQKKDIVKIRDGKYEKCANKIIRQNGEIEKLSAPDWIAECDTIKDVIKTLKSKDIWPAVEIIDNEKSGSFYLGPIIATGKKIFQLYCYDAAGKWESIYKLPYDEIFRIEFDSKYCNHFNRFMRSKRGNGKS